MAQGRHGVLMRASPHGHMHDRGERAREQGQRGDAPPRAHARGFKSPRFPFSLHLVRCVHLPFSNFDGSRSDGRVLRACGLLPAAFELSSSPCPTGDRDSTGRQRAGARSAGARHRTQRRCAHHQCPHVAIAGVHVGYTGVGSAWIAIVHGHRYGHSGLAAVGAA